MGTGLHHILKYIAVFDRDRNRKISLWPKTITNKQTITATMATTNLHRFTDMYFYVRLNHQLAKHEIQ